ncbi:hypothetical protein [Colwellia echini]|uniref:Amino acid transport protein n=1 Tax=Colwellia echini TaxID=1982103 RepID=A0ABY3MT69_9GAMM|nr:hypothetical protein [Colwellia echini]TYK64396.1 hypothetical protein CWS31_015895 [Colwellia echini]
MDMSTIMVWSVLFSGVGFGFFMYGRKQKSAVPLCVGITLFILPYIIPNVTMLLIIGAILVIIPYFIKI